MKMRDGMSVPYFPLKVKELGAEWYVSNSIEQETYKLNDHGHYLLQQCNGSNTYDEIAKHISNQYRLCIDTCKEQMDNILNPMTQAGMLWWRKVPMKWNHTPPPQSIFWELTWGCNLKCIHCVVSAGSKSIRRTNFR